MADAAVGFLLENLQQLLLYNAELIGDAKDQVEGLHQDLLLFKAFIRDSTEMRISNQTLQALVNEIRGVVDIAEDAMDKFVVEKAILKARNPLRKAIHDIDHFAAVRTIAKNIEFIRLRIKQIYDQKQFGFKELHLENIPERGIEKKASPTVEEGNVVGFDGEAETVIKRLNGEHLNLDIITIIGMPGLGKTTLARKIYNDPAIQYEFFTHAWVYVSQSYSKREVCISILSTIKQEADYTNKLDEVITKELHDLLEKGKYLIVMDDVWTAEAWNDLKNVFPDNNKGSRILLTSRHNEVALCANPTGEPHNLKFLTTEESWELLEIRVFGKGKCPPGERQTLGEHIAAKCEGLPLAIVVFAGIILNNRETDDWWKQVAMNVNTFIVKDEKQFMEVIAMSYHHLPYHLKSCFLYLGVFPEDYEIPVWKLIRLWIAEGFIEQDGEISLEEIAEACLTDLVNRSLLMASKRNSNGQIKTCHVHDMLYDFCKKEAGKQNFYQEIKNFDDETPVSYRRVCVHSEVMNYMESKPQGQHVRSFLCYPPDEITLPQEHMWVIPTAFELLRVLDIISISLDTFPTSILQLVLLRYIAITCNIKTPPENFFKLWNLQTLIFKTDERTLELNEEMWKMYQLRHLHTNASALLPRPPSGKAKGRENVQTLSMISPESCTEHVFARTPCIKKLGVKGKLAVLFNNLFDQVGKLQHLTNLKLYNDRGHSKGGKFSLPPAYKFPKKLKKLTLSNTLLDWEEMQILGSLEKLEVLKLKDNAFKGPIWAPKDGGFLALKRLHIGRTNLMTWKASKHHFPSLKHLVLQHCMSLVEVPSGFAEISSFQELELYRTNPYAAPSARKIQLKKMSKAVRETKTSGVFKLSVYPPDM